MTLIHTKSYLFNKYNDITQKYMDNTNVNQPKQRQDRHGSANPMFNRHHSEQSKSLMRQKALQRNQEYKKWKDSQHHVSMDEFLSANPSVKEYIKVLAQSVIKEEIDKLVWRKQNQRLSIPI